MPDCRKCQKYKELLGYIGSAIKVASYPWEEILKGQAALLRDEIRAHESDAHTLKCVTGEDGND